MITYRYNTIFFDEHPSFLREISPSTQFLRYKFFYHLVDTLH